MSIKNLIMWQSDSNTNNCTKCNSTFTYWLRKHHCRSCGYIYCYYCIQKTINIPNYIKLPTAKSSMFSNFFNKTMHKVCDTCFYNISILKQNKLVEIFNLINFDIKDIKTIAQVSKDWNIYAEHYKKIYKSLQYENRKLNFLELKIFKNNLHYFPGHDIWSRQAVYYELDIKFFDKKIQTCSNILCSKKCGKFPYETSLILCNHQILDSKIQLHALNNLKNYKLYIYYLLNQGINSPFTTIIDWLFSKIDDIEIANEIFWFIRSNNNNSLKYKALLNRWNNECLHKEKILQSEKLIKILETVKSNQLKEEINKINIVIPIYLNYENLKLINITYKNSVNRPILLTFVDNNNNLVKVLYKPENLFRDKCIMSVIHTVDDILKEEIGDMYITKYKILPTSFSAGLIEIIEGETVYTILKNDNLINHIMRNNPTLTSLEIRDRFIKSTAAYSVITFLLSVNDRHQNNLLITNDGLLFHVDYGAILDRDSKNIDEIRVSDDIIKALGQDFKKFKKLCGNKIYNKLRCHINVIYNLLSILTCIDLNQIQKALFKKFMPGASKRIAKLSLYTSINRSSYTYKIVDLLHSSQQDGLIGKFNNFIKFSN